MSYIKKKETCAIQHKICYSRREASEILNSLRHHKIKNVRINKGKIPSRAYYCRFCSSYHLTSKSAYRNVMYDLNKKDKRLKVLNDGNEEI